MNEAGTANSFFGQFMIVLLIFVGVLALTYFVTRWIAGYTNQKRSGSNIQLIESAPLSTNKSIQIVRVGKKYVAIATSKDNVTLLAELTENEIVEPKTQNMSGGSFKDILSRAKSFSEEEKNE